MIELIKSELIPIKKLVNNNGQIEGLPKNPRIIKDNKYLKLKASIEENPEFLGARELLVYAHENNFVILAGNMRFKVAQELNFKEIPCKVIPSSFTIEQLKAIVIKDNVSYGSEDWDALANEWDYEQLQFWGLDVINDDNENKNNENGDIKFSNELDYESNYIVLKFSKDIDFIYIESLLNLESTYSKRQNGKPWSKGIGRVVDGIDAIIKFKES